MSEKFIKAIRADDVSPGGMKAIELDGKEIVVCNCGGKYFAVQRRCGHMNAPLEMGTLDGTYLTCAMHSVHFDVTTGEVLSGPVPTDFGKEVPPPMLSEYLQNVGMLMKHIHNESIRTYTVIIENGWVQIAL